METPKLFIYYRRKVDESVRGEDWGENEVTRSDGAGTLLLYPSGTLREAPETTSEPREELGEETKLWFLLSWSLYTTLI